MEISTEVCSKPGCESFAVRPGGRCHDCLEDDHEPAMVTCKRCKSKVNEFTVPYCPTCKTTGDF